MKKVDKKVCFLLLLLIVILVAGGLFFSRKGKNTVDDLLPETTEEQNRADEEYQSEVTDSNVEIRYQSEKIYAYTGDGGDYVWNVNGEPEILSLSGNFQEISLIAGKLIREQVCDFSEVSSEDIYRCYFMSQQGEIWMAGTSADKEHYTIWQYDEEQKKLQQKIVLEKPKDEENPYEVQFVKKLILNEAYIYLLADTENGTCLWIYDWEGKLVYEESAVYDVDVPDLNTVIAGKGNSIEKLVVTDGNIIKQWQKDLEDNMSTIRRVNCDSQNNRILIQTMDEILVTDMEASKMPEVIFDFQRDTLDISQDFLAVNCWVDTDDNVYIGYWDFENELINKMIYRFTPYQKQAATEESITVTLPFPIDIVNIAAEKYEEKYPGRSVQIDTAYISEEEWHSNSSIYGEQMTARMMTGDYGDILLASYGVYSRDVLNTDTFMDLTEWIKTVDNYQNLNQNIIEAQKVEGVLRGIPLAMDYGVWYADRTFMKTADKNQDGNLTWSEVLDEAISWPNQDGTSQYLFLVPYGLETIVTTNIYDLVDLTEKKIDIRQEWFLDLIQKWMAVNDAGSLVSHVEEDNSYEENKARRCKIYQVDMVEEGKIARKLFSEAWRYYELDQNPENGIDYVMLAGISGEKNRNFMAFPRLFFAVNNMSEKKEAVLEFLEVLLSDEVQERIDYGLIPLSNAVLQKQFEEAKQTKEGLTEKQLEDYYNNKVKIINQVDWMYGYLCSGDLCEALDAYVEGKLTLEEALDQAEEKMWIRLNE